MPLFVLAFDHRASLMRSFFGIEADPSDVDVDRARAAKRVIADALLSSVANGHVPAPDAGALVDATFGGDAIAALRAGGIRFAVPVEESGRAELALEEGWRARLDELRPAWAKVLVRYNPDGDGAMNRRQRSRLGELSAHCSRRGLPLMVELIVPPEPAQVGPLYDTQVRPRSTVRAIEEIRGDGIAADVWKVEGLERREDTHRVSAAAGAPCIVLGRGADAEAVDRWLLAAAGVEGYDGFAIGRSIWWDPLGDWVKGVISRNAAVARIAERYERFVAVYRRAKAG
jgi:myo-inositol catabolism protein IolC